MNARVDLIPAFNDNYLFSLTVDDKSMVVDPGSAPEILRYLKENKLHLETILLTHHHGDHIGGVNELRKITGATVLGPEDLPDYGVTPDKVLKDGDRFAFQGVDFATIAVPGHTLDHLAYFAPGIQVLFCGDTIFGLGCGRLFEGTFEQMYASLAKLRALPETTKIYCAHEYTVNNARFSLKYMTETNAGEKTLNEYRALLKDLEQRRAQGLSTVPSTIGFESRYNLFMKAGTVSEFTDVRKARNQF